MNNISVQDQTGKFVLLPSPAARIVSLVPSQTELLYDLRLEREVVGITKFCVHPDEWFRTKTRIGGTKNLNIEGIRQLNPDLVIAGKEENRKEQVEQIEMFCPVYTSNVMFYEDALQMISDIGFLTNKTRKAKEIVQEIQAAFSVISTPNYHTALYLIWREPWMGAGNDTFINSMLNKAGFRNVLQHLPRYPQLTESDLVSLKPDVVFLSSEPYPFKVTHLNEIKRILPTSKVILADGEMFSWYGSRMRFAPTYFFNLREQLHL